MKNKDLLYERTNVYETASDEKLKTIFAYSEGYKAFLNAAKTEREAVREGIRIAEENGYRFMPAEAIVPSGGISAAKISSFAHWISMIQLLGLALTLKAAFAQKLHFRRIGEGKTMRPQERAELHAIAYRFP